jgi:integrase
MPKTRLTASGIKALQPTGGKRTEYFDGSLPGFSVRVSPKGRKSFCVLYRRGRRLRRYTLGTYPILSPAEARAMARQALGEVARGGDPAARKVEERKARTFAELAEEYLERYAKPNKKSWKEDERIIINKLNPVLGLFVTAIIKLQLLTAQRGGEVLSMEWPDVDLSSGWWTIPGERSKNGLPHRVPLSPPALALLKDLRERSDSSHWVFPSARVDSHIRSVQKAVERIRRRAGIEFRGHDLRRTAASFMTSMGISRLVVARILNHAESGITAVYDRYSYDSEKRQALDAWAQRLQAIVAGTTALYADPSIIQNAVLRPPSAGHR